MLGVVRKRRVSTVPVRVLILTGMAIAGGATSVLAQDAAAPAAAPASASSVVVYDQDFFARYDLNTAEDLLRRIPGVSAILDAGVAQQGRGFGSGGAQVLIEGRRFPGKSNEINTTLRRISAANIERVELISGSSEAIEVQSQGVIVNLIMKPGASIGGLGSWELNGRFNDDGWYGVDGLLSYTKTTGPLTYLAGIERNLWSPPGGGAGRWTDRTRDEAYYYPTGQLQELRPQDWHRDHDKWIYTGSVVYDLANGDRANLNLLYQTLHITETDETDLTRYSTVGAETLRARESHVRDIDALNLFEAGGEYNSGVGPGDLTVLFIVRRDTTPTLDFRNRYEPARTVEVSRSFSEVSKGEDILRGSYRFPLAKGQTLELGAEGARNTLEQSLQAFFDLNGDGVLEPVVIPTADPEVEEMRGEVFAIHKWSVTEKLSLDSSLNYEFSRLTTNYPQQPARDLAFPKPRIDARYKPSAPNQFRVLIERTVSQLDFANFVPRYNVVDDRIEIGNPALEPEKTWVYELGFEHRLSQDGGLLEARVFYNDITDPIDKVPLVDVGGFLVSATGNADKARLYGVEGKASVRLGFVGLRDAQLSLRALQQWSEITDPFNGRTRTLANDRTYNFDIGFRHDVTKLKGAYGFSYKNYGENSITSDLLVTEYFTLEPTLEAFVERQIFGNMTLRLEAQNLTGSIERRSRTLYTVNSIDGAARRFDVFREVRDIRANIHLHGRF